VSTSLRKLLESQKKRFSKIRNGWATRLIEMDGMDAPIDAPVDMPAPEPEVEADPDAALAAGFRAAIMAVIDDTTMDLASKKKKIGTLLTTQDKLMNETEPAPVEEETDYDDEGESDVEKTEAIKERDDLRRKLKIRDLIEEAGIKPDKTLRESLEHLPEATARKLLEREKVRGGSPRSEGFTGRKTEEYKPAEDGKEFARRIKG
jgi:hypothetical protein